MTKLITLKAWLAITYGDDQPHINTVRLWIRDHKIVPAPRKHGRAYYVVPDARYRAPGEPAKTLMERIGRAT